MLNTVFINFRGNSMEVIVFNDPGSLDEYRSK